MVDLSFAFSITGTYHLRFFAGKTKGTECTGGWTQFVSLSIRQYISSRKISANWRATATYVGMVFEYVAMLWSAYHCVHSTSCLCTLSVSAFVHRAVPTSARLLFRNLFMETLHIGLH